MAAAVAQLDATTSGSQLLSSTHWAASCSSDDLCSDASSINSKPLLKPSWQSLYAKRTADAALVSSRSSSSQVLAAAGGSFLQEHEYTPQLQLQCKTTDVGALQEPQQQLLTPSPAGPPPARYLKLSCKPLGNAPAGLLTEGPEDPGIASAAAVASRDDNASRTQLQQWLARHEAAFVAKSVAGAARSSSSSEADAVDAQQLCGPAFELAQALPPPAFLILGMLG